MVWQASEVKVLLCPTLRIPMNYTVQAEFSRLHWSGSLLLLQGIFLTPGIELGSPALPVDSLLLSYPGIPLLVLKRALPSIHPPWFGSVVITGGHA